MKEILWVKSKHGRIYTEIEGETKTAVLFFYGLFDSIDNSNSKLIKNNLIKNNISTISFDYIGHGKSEEDINKISTSRILSDIDNIMSHIKNKFSKIFIYGNSFGGYLGIIASSRYKFIYGLILLNPVSNMIELLLRKQSEEELSKNTNKHNEIN